jgi:hypothetical protein
LKEHDLLKISATEVLNNRKKVQMAEEMKKYRVAFTITKSFETEVFFEAPNAEVAAEMASDMEQDDSEFISERSEDEDGDVDSVTLDGEPIEWKYQTVKVDRSIQKWCEQWIKDRAEEEAEEAS